MCRCPSRSWITRMSTPCSSRWVAAGKQPVRGPATLPIAAKNAEQMLGQNRVAILAPFALPNADDHTCTIDISRRQRDGLGNTQTRRVDRNEGGSQLEIGYRLKQTLDLLTCEHSGQIIQPAGHRDLLGYVRPPQCRAVEE